MTKYCHEWSGSQLVTDSENIYYWHDGVDVVVLADM